MKTIFIHIAGLDKARTDLASGRNIKKIKLAVINLETARTPLPSSEPYFCGSVSPTKHNLNPLRTPHYKEERKRCEDCMRSRGKGLADMLGVKDYFKKNMKTLPGPNIMTRQCFNH